MNPRLVVQAAIALLLAGLVLAGPVQAAYDITGTVTDDAGKPLSGALVVLYSAGPRPGGDGGSPWCYPDCGRHAVTAPDGSFAFRGVSSLWAATLYAEADGYMSNTASADTKSTAPVRFKLLSNNHPNRFTRGRLLAHDGTPVAGIAVRVWSVRTLTGQTEGFTCDHRATTDAEGRFTIRSDVPLSELTVLADAPRHVSKSSFALRPGAEENTLQLVSGATLIGRVLRKARPAANVVVKALAAVDGTDPSNWPTLAATTDADGRFTLEHVPPDAPCWVFTAMEPLAEKNEAAIVRQLIAPADQRSFELGELNLHPAHTIRGRVAALDAALPEKLRVRIERPQVDDTLDAPVAPDGTFVLSGVPAEMVSLSFRIEGRPSLSGLVIAGPTLGRVGSQNLIGRVDEDVQLYVLLERGPTKVLPRALLRYPGASLGNRPLRGVPEVVFRELAPTNRE
jgi:hypothetical protein